MRRVNWILMCLLFGCATTLPPPVNTNPLQMEATDQKVYKWKEGIENLVIQIIKNMEDKGHLNIALFDFRGRNGAIGPDLSNKINSEIKANLSLVDDISVIEKNIMNNPESADETARVIGADMYITGSYWINEEGLRINARLIRVKTGTIISAGKVLIREDEIPSSLRGLSTGKEDMAEGSYDLTIDRLLNIEKRDQSFNIKVWTDKEEYQIGDTIKFYFSTDRNCYLTLIDIGTSGKATILFPNPYIKDDLIMAGITYTIPDDSYGFDINIEGPSGLERIKAICSTSPIPLLKMDVSRGFFSIERGDKLPIRELSRSIERLESIEFSEAYTELFINPEGGIQKGSRGLSKRPPEKPIDIIGVPGRR